MSSFIQPADNGVSSLASLPPTSLLIREKSSITIFNGPNVLEQTADIPTYTMASTLFPATAALRMPPIYDNSGRLVCLVPERERPAIYDATSFVRLVELDITDVVRAEFSPRGQYLVTWSMPTKGGDSSVGNLKVWSIASGSLVSHYSQKTFKSDLIQWAMDDSICFRQVSNEIHVYQSINSLAPSDTVAKILHPGYTQYKIAKVEGEEKVNVAVFNPEAGGKPARATLFTLNTASWEVDGPLNSRTIFGATEANLMWNKTGLSLLIHSQSDIDSSNKSYYGAMGLYLMHSRSDLSIKVEQTKEGPVHAAQWSPTGDRFAVAAGNMPCQGTLHNERGEPIFQFGAAHRNAVSWSPHGRFLCLAGFGNLAGEMDFYDTVRLKKLGSNVSHCATVFGWSPDSRYFMTASLAPRMNVDNCFKLFKYNGVGPVYQQDFEKAYDAVWKAAPVGLYPDRPPTPLRRGADGEPIAAVAPQKTAAPAPAPYRPPRSTGALSNFMKDSSSSVGPTGKVKKETEAKFVPSVQKAQRIIPGMAPQQANQQKKKPAAAAPSPAPAKPAAAPSPVPAKAPNTTAASAVSKPVTAPVVAAVAAPAVAAETAESKEKRAKAIQKKLKQIQEIKEKVATGQPVEPEQLKKLETESELQRELASLR